MEKVIFDKKFQIFGISAKFPCPFGSKRCECSFSRSVWLGIKITSVK